MFNFEIKNKNPDKVAEEIEKGGTLPIGKYVVEFSNHNQKSVSGKTVDELSFVVAHGPYKGRKVKADLFHEGSDAEKTEKLQNQCIHFGVKLGCIEVKEKKGKKTYEYVKESFEEAIGEIVVVKVAHQKDKNTGNLFAKVDMFGIWNLEDKEAKEALKGYKGSNDEVSEEEEEEEVNV